MEPWTKLGERTLAAWERVGLEEAAFPQVALEALRQASLPTSDPLALLGWAAKAALPPQVNLEASFGEPPITVFRHARFYIELLFWLDGTTSIHHHGFSGAFEVLFGSSLHVQHTFSLRERLADHLLLGDLSVQSAELLRAGDRRAIPLGANLIHALFHLDRPSVSVVVRTFQDPAKTPQHKYLRPHVAVDTEHHDEAATRRQQVLQCLSQLSPGRYATLISELVETSDRAGLFHVLQHANRVLGNTPLFSRLLSQARAKHGPCVELFERVFEGARRDAVLKTQRALVHEPAERFFIALVLNLPSRHHILEFLGRRFPESPAVETAARLFERVTRPEADPKQALKTAISWTAERRDQLRSLLNGASLNPGDDPFHALLERHPYQRLFGPEPL